MTDRIDLICLNCKHRELGKLGCKAFPNGIPDSIIESNKHNKRLKEQKNNLVFEKKNG